MVFPIIFLLYVNQPVKRRLGRDGEKKSIGAKPWAPFYGPKGGVQFQRQRYDSSLFRPIGVKQNASLMRKGQNQCLVSAKLSVVICPGVQHEPESPQRLVFGPRNALFSDRSANTRPTEGKFFGGLASVTFERSEIDPTYILEPKNIIGGFTGRGNLYLPLGKIVSDYK
jgi:hypothetical protein